jgi:hypothetical protein
MSLGDEFQPDFQPDARGPRRALEMHRRGWLAALACRIVNDATQLNSGALGDCDLIWKARTFTLRSSTIRHSGTYPLGASRARSLASSRWKTSAMTGISSISMNHTCIWVPATRPCSSGPAGSDTALAIEDRLTSSFYWFRISPFWKHRVRGRATSTTVRAERRAHCQSPNDRCSCQAIFDCGRCAPATY